MSERLRIAVIGAGIAGITAAHCLSRKHTVTLFEKAERIGGHTNTIPIVEGPDAGIAVDTGFIVLNDRTYPALHRFLRQLRVPHRDSDMSFGYYDERSGLQYAGTDNRALFATPRNFLNLGYLRMLLEVPRFNRLGAEDLRAGGLDGVTLGEWLRGHGFSDALIRDFVVPLGAAVWSTAPERMMRFPARLFLHFFRNHGLLTLNDRPQWQTVVGGSHSYLKAFAAQFNGSIVTAAGIRGIARDERGVTVHFLSGKQERFDRAVVAAHADEALRLLLDPSAEERRLLGPWNYEKNRTVLHTDASVMPPSRRAWASWNYVRERESKSATVVSLTYDMNRLMGLRTRRRYFVTLNRTKPIRADRIVCEIMYTHPNFTLATAATQAELPSLNGVRNTWFCGSYFRFGFHEDACRAGAAVGKDFGLPL